MEKFAYVLIAISIALLTTLRFDDSVELIVQVLVHIILIGMVALGGLILKEHR